MTTHPVWQLGQSLAVLLVRAPVLPLAVSGAVEHVFTPGADSLGLLSTHQTVTNRSLRGLQHTWRNILLYNSILLVLVDDLIVLDFFLWSSREPVLYSVLDVFVLFVIHDVGESRHISQHFILFAGRNLDLALIFQYTLLLR